MCARTRISQIHSGATMAATVKRKVSNPIETVGEKFHPPSVLDSRVIKEEQESRCCVDNTQSADCQRRPGGGNTTKPEIYKPTADKLEG